MSKSKINNKKYRDYNISAIDEHKRDKKTFIPPLEQLSSIQGFQKTSWRDDRMPEMLWVVLLTSVADRDEYLDAFRVVLHRIRELFEKNEKNYDVTMTGIECLTEDEFFFIFVDIIEKYSNALLPMLIYKDLPAKELWKKFLPQVDELSLKPLYDGVCNCLDHQSEKATDVRWFRVMMLIVNGKLYLPTGDDESVREILEYPNYGDLRAVRPSIRALEMGFSVGFMERSDNDIKKSVKWNNDFWQESFDKLDCIYPTYKLTNKINYDLFFDDLSLLTDEVIKKYYECVKASYVNDELDVVFGLVMYAIDTCISCISSKIDNRKEGLILLRTIVETYITLKYLYARKDGDKWKKFKNYGLGVSKLTFLKQIQLDETDIPGFLDVDELYLHINEEQSQEFQDINIGNWDNITIREMASQSGIKDFYDKYYDWLSAYSHATWGAIRSTNYVVCLNPLHRFHKILSLQLKDNFNSCVPDMFKIINLMLDIINQKYPPFKLRLKSHREDF